MLDQLLSIFYPQTCEHCSQSVEHRKLGVACGNCWANTRIFSGVETLCSKCGAFLNNSPSNNESYCRKCDLQSYERAFAAGLYEKALAATIIHLKTVPYLSTVGAEHLINTFHSSNIENIDLIIPVPLSKRRFHERGYNQAEVLAKVIKRSINIPVDSASLLRTVHTAAHRVGMDAKAREKTVQKAFAVKRKNLIENKNILLVDDVFTTGSTVSACGKVLKQNGAGKVYVLTLARAY